MIISSKSKQFILGIAFVIAVLIGLVFYGYTTGSSNALVNGLKKVLPVAIVGGNSITISDVEENLQILKRLEPYIGGEFAYNKLIERTRNKILAAGFKLDWESKINEELNFYIQNRDSEYSELLKNYFRGDKELFVKYVVEPRVVEALLRTYYNGDYRSNEENYNHAEALLDKVLSGNDFAALAKVESDDKLSAQFGGDLGFFKESELLPELEQQIQKGPMGEIQKSIFVSRLGYHIIWPVETAEKDLPAGRQVAETLWHAKHILIQTQGFENWLKQQTDKISVWRIN